MYFSGVLSLFPPAKQLFIFAYGKEGTYEELNEILCRKLLKLCEFSEISR